MANWEGKPTLASVLKGYTPPTESALADPIKEHLRTLPAQLATNQAALDNAIASWNKTDFATGKPNPNYRPEAIQELAQLMPGIGGLTAWHGTPHKIQGQFDISKVGTGEGAQAYGHGMYFAENPDVAKMYQAALSNTKYKVGERELKGNEAWAAQFLHDFQDDALPKRVDVNTAIKKAKETLNPGETQTEIVNKIKELEKAGLTVENGNLYKVDIPDEYIPNMLDWDKPLLEQSKPVQEALAKLGIKTDAKRLNEFDDALLNALMGDTSNPLPKQPINPTGADIYQRFIQGNPELTSKKLNEAGIKGIRYLDEGSRGNYRAQTTYKGEPYSDILSFKTKGQLDDFIKEKEAEGFGIKTFPQTSNFVVFDPSTVKILEENSKPVSRKELIEKQVKDLKD